ncbi:GNAT family N-acetyltransferase [Microbacterium schleiferi]|uniref:GNAT family N-acetyltransferase n=1 Tax=Microbacterium schleiferi TaxID=69362 RepID=A0A7S8MUV7_9MICO|nr:GNAT family N-acetyltransferase [Microbacterium schleiferi]QPE03534.1 GNAT family N-acetyltransferase [Microbacterium schleiferi]
MTTATPDIRPLTIPSSLEAPEAADFLEMVRVRNIVYDEISGNRDEELEPAVLLPHYQPSPFEQRLIWGVWTGGEFVGRAGLDLPHDGDAMVAYAQIELRRHAWGHGVGTAALGILEAAARAHGRRIIESWIEHPTADGEQVTPPTGFGHIPLDHAARFVLRHGYALEQVERKSVLDVSATSMGFVEDLHRRALDAADGYDVVSWHPPTPPEFVADYAWMKSRMSVDAPSAGMEIAEESWDAARILEHDTHWIDGGRDVLVVAARERQSGRLVAFTELASSPGHPVTHQEDTLVLREHRGHRLGMLIKTAALLRWRELSPHTQRVLTYNAEENRPMLAVNEAIGFDPVAYVGAWKKDLALFQSAR